MASQFYTPKLRSHGNDRVVLGVQPFNRDNVFLAFGSHAKCAHDGQDLAGKGALVFEGEVLELPVVSN